MQDYLAQVEKLRKDAAECALIRDLATDQAKLELFDRLASHLTVLANQVEQASLETKDRDPKAAYIVKIAAASATEIIPNATRSISNTKSLLIGWTPDAWNPVMCRLYQGRTYCTLAVFPFEGTGLFPASTA